MTPAECIYESVKDRLTLPLDAFVRATGDWEFVPVMENGQMIGAVMRKGNELHVGFTRQGACIRGQIRRILGDVLAAYGSAVTMVRRSNGRGLRFCERLGFEKTHEENGVVFMKCLRCKYVQ
jgi:hypothetical protein